MITTKKTAAASTALACVLFLLCAAGAKLSAQPPAPGAADALARPIATVADKTDTSIAGAHDYVSLADSDPAQPARDDRQRLQTFFDTVDTLATAWRADRNTAAAKRAGEWLRAWLVSPATRMNPSLDYAQVTPGANNNRGIPAGIIEARDFGRIVANLATLDKSPALTDTDKAAIRSWFDIYLDWLLTSKNGAAARAARDSNSTWFIAQALPIALHAGRDSLARALAEEMKKNMSRQLSRDGSQPEELRNANSLGASASNIEAYARIAKAAAPLDVDLWNYATTSHSSLSRAIDFLAPYNNNPATWPLPQKTPLQPGFLTPLIKERDAMVKPDSAVGTMPAISPAKPVLPPPAPPPISGPATAPMSAPAPIRAPAPAPNYEPAPAQAFGTAPASTSPRVETPAARQSNPDPTGATSIVIIIQNDGAIILNGQRTTEEQLPQQLSQTRTATRRIPVFISVDENTPTRTLASVLDTCRKSGLSRITMQTQTQ